MVHCVWSDYLSEECLLNIDSGVAGLGLDSRHSHRGGGTGGGTGGSQSGNNSCYRQRLW